MNPELPNDWLEEALKARAALSAPPDFSATIIRRLEGGHQYSALSRFWMDQGVAVGLTLALVGLGSLVDLNGLAILVVRGMQATPVVLAIFALCVSAVWLSRTADEAT